MNCKFCNAELEEGITLCPACGQENLEDPVPEAAEAEPATEVTQEITEEAEEEVPAEEMPAEEPKKKAPKWLVALAVVGALAIALVLGAAVYFGVDAAGLNVKSYTVSDEKAMKAKNTVVATVGDVELSNNALQVYYWQTANDFYTNYGGYAPVDFTKPLDEQFYDEAAGITWQQYFLDGALSAWSRYAALYMQAEKDGFQLSQDMQEYLDSIPDQLDDMAVSYGYETAEAMLNADMGVACDKDGYMEYIALNFTAGQYLDSLYDSIVPDLAQIEAYYEENTDLLKQQGIVKDGSYTVDVRHILLTPKGGTEDDNGNVTYSEQEWEQCRLEAQALLDQWQADGTEEGFAQLAMEHTEDPGSMSNGGLYTDVYVGQMVEPFETWCFDESRQYGDTGLVQTNYGYHVMYFVASEEVWVTNVSDYMIYERSLALVNDAAASWPMEYNDKKIILCDVKSELVN